MSRAATRALARIQAWPGSSLPPVAPTRFDRWARNARTGLMVAWLAISVPVLSVGFEGNQATHAFVLAGWAGGALLVCWAGMRMDSLVGKAVAMAGRGLPIGHTSAILLWRWSGDPALRDAMVRWMAASPEATLTSCELALVVDYVRSTRTTHRKPPLDVSLNGESVEQILNRNGMRDEAFARKMANSIGSSTPSAKGSSRISRL